MNILGNFLKIFILLFILALSGSRTQQLQSSTEDVNATTSRTTTPTNVLTTELRPVVERIFSRRKRFLLLPKNASMKFTIALSKRLLALFPRGLNFAVEAATYYPMPSARIELIPKFLRPKTPTTPKPTGTTPPHYVYIPGSLLRYRAKPASKPQKVQRIDDDATKLQWVNSEKYKNSSKWTAQWAKYDTPAYGQKYSWTPAKQGKYTAWQSAPHAKWTKWTTTPLPRLQQWRTKPSLTAPQTNKWWQPNQRWSRAAQQIKDMDEKSNQNDNAAAGVNDSDNIKRNPDADYNVDEQLAAIEPLYFPDLEPVRDWKHYHSHRDRRQLFYQFEGLSKILGIDIKSCILRAICDGKRFLLPPGYSMIQDILRVVFTFPTISGLDDEYSRAMQSDYATCDKYLHGKQCPLNLLHWFMNKDKNI